MFSHIFLCSNQHKWYTCKDHAIELITNMQSKSVSVKPTAFVNDEIPKLEMFF